MRRRPSPGLSIALGSIATVAAHRVAQQRIEGEGWRRVNFRGTEVDLLAGPAVAAGVAVAGVVSGGLAVPVAVCGAAVVGRMDDVRGQRLEEVSDKGIRGHLSALREGRVSAGMLKVGGLVGVGVLAARVSGRRSSIDIAIDAACIAGSANVVNLFDLRPGRALKVTAIAAGAASVLGAPTASILGVSVAALPLDLRERSMLGDTGANSLGAGLAALALRGRGRFARLVFLSGISGLTLASERVSFSKIIDANLTLRRIDQFGRVKR